MVDEDKPIEFGDGVHPSMLTKIAYGWIRQGHKRKKSILMSSINLETIDLAMRDYFKKLRKNILNLLKFTLF